MSDTADGSGGYRKLRVWHLAMDVVEETYRMTSRFPKQEAFGLTSQMQRAAVSVPSNIAEGHTRDHIAEFARFVSIARGSVSELETQVELARRIRHITNEEAVGLNDQLERLGRQLTSLRKALHNKVREDNKIYDSDYREQLN